jgi:thioredoxin 1
MIEVTEQDELTKHLKMHPRVIALFYASWCPFCRSFLSTFNKQAQNPGKDMYMRVQIDEDENPMWETYTLNAVPSIILFENGEVAKRLDCQMGMGLNEQQFKKWLEAVKPT